MGRVPDFTPNAVPRFGRSLTPYSRVLEVPIAHLVSPKGVGGSHCPSRFDEWSLILLVDAPYAQTTFLDREAHHFPSDLVPFQLYRLCRPGSYA